jgi:hypothetical protein
MALPTVARHGRPPDVAVVDVALGEKARGRARGASGGG